jgi:hypothetical protein
MPHLTTSAVLDTPAGPVWTLLRNFAAIGSWHPVLPPTAEEKVAAAVRDGVLLPGLAALQTRFATEGA